MSLFKHKTPHLKRGFNLMELLITIGIIAVLAAVVIGSFAIDARNKATNSKKINTLDNVLLEAKLFGVSNNDSYALFCQTPKVGSQVAAAVEDLDCYDESSTNILRGWAAQTPLAGEDGYYCVDHLGNRGTTSESTISDSDATCDLVVVSQGEEGGGGFGGGGFSTQGSAIFQVTSDSVDPAFEDYIGDWFDSGLVDSSGGTIWTNGTKLAHTSAGPGGWDSSWLVYYSSVEDLNSGAQFDYQGDSIGDGTVSDEFFTIVGAQAGLGGGPTVFVVTDSGANPGFSSYAGNWYDSGETSDQWVTGGTVWTNGSRYAIAVGTGPDWDDEIMDYFETLADAQSGATSYTTQSYSESGVGSNAAIHDVNDAYVVVGKQYTPGSENASGPTVFVMTDYEIEPSFAERSGNYWQYYSGYLEPYCSENNPIWTNGTYYIGIICGDTYMAPTPDIVNTYGWFWSSSSGYSPDDITSIYNLEWTYSDGNWPEPVVGESNPI